MPLAPVCGEGGKGFINAVVNSNFHVPEEFAEVGGERGLGFSCREFNAVFKVRDEFEGHDEIAEDFGDVSEALDAHGARMEAWIFGDEVHGGERDEGEACSHDDDHPEVKKMQECK